MATDRRVNVKVDADVSEFNRGILSAAATLKTLDKGIDHSNDRTAWLAQSVLGLGPAFVPIGAAAVPIIAGLSAELLAAGTAAGIAVFAFQGVGDGLKALNDYQVKPTAENLAKLNEAFAKLGPDGEHFVRFLDKVGSQLSPLQNIARGGIFPGVEEGITSLMTLLPQATRIVRDMAEAMGQISADAGANLAGPKFTAFFDYLERDGRPILEATARTAGNFVDGIAAMTVAFAPLTNQFVGGFERMSESFAEWAHGLEDSDSFASFLQYIEDNGPRVEQLFEAMGGAIVSILEAAAPVGAVLVPALTQLLDVISAIAQTPFGPLLLGFASLISLWGRLRALQQITTGGSFGTLTAGLRGSTKSAAGQVKADMGVIASSFLTAGAQSERGAKRVEGASTRLRASGGKIAAGAAVLGATATGLTDKIGLTNTAMGALIGTMVAPGVGTAIGAIGGAMLDLASGIKHADDNAQAAKSSFDAMIKSADTARLKSYLDTHTSSTVQPRADQEQAPRFTGGRGVNPGQYGAQEQAIKRVTEAQKAYYASLDNDATAGSRRNMALLADGVNLTAAGYRTAAQSAADFTAKLETLNAAITGEQSMIDFERAIDQTGKALKDNGKTLDRNNEKGRVNREVLLGIASSALKVAEGMKRTDSIKFMDKARGDLIAAARQMGATRKEANRLADRLLGVDKIRAKPKADLIKDRADAKIKQLNGALDHLDSRHPKPKVDADISRVRAAIAQAQRVIDGLHDRRVSVDIVTHYINIGNRPKAPSPGAGGNADGGPVIGPGGPRDDLVPRWLSNGEFVLRADTYKRFRNEIEWMHAQGMANGGRVGTPSVSVGSPRIDLRGMQVVANFDGVGQLVGRIARIEANEAIADHQEMVLTTAGATY